MRSFAIDGIATNKLLNDIELCFKNEEKKNVLIVVNPRLNYEISHSVKKYFNYAKNMDNFILATYGLEGTDFYSETYKEQEKYWKFINPKEVKTFYNNKSISTLEDKQSIKGVVIFSSKEDFINTSKDWFSEVSFNKNEYALNYQVSGVVFYCKNF